MGDRTKVSKKKHKHIENRLPVCLTLLCHGMRQNKTEDWLPPLSRCCDQLRRRNGRTGIVNNSRNKASNDKHKQVEKQIAKMFHLVVSDTKQNKTRYCSPTLSRCCDLSCGARMSRRTRTVKNMGKSWVHSKKFWRAS